MFKAYKPNEEKIVLNFGGVPEAVVAGKVSVDDVPEFLHLDGAKEPLRLSEQDEVVNKAALLFELLDL